MVKRKKEGREQEAPLGHRERAARVEGEMGTQTAGLGGGEAGIPPCLPLIFVQITGKKGKQPDQARREEEKWGRAYLA